MPPSVTVPPPPAGFIPVRGATLRGYTPLEAELRCVPGTIAEVSTSTNWALIFGITAPTTQEVVQRLQVAMAWSDMLGPTEAWYHYVKSQEGSAWKDVLLTLQPMKAAFQLATTANPAVLKQYAALSQLLGAQGVVGKQAAATRAGNAKATAKANAATVAALPATAQAAATAGTPAVTEATSVATPGRVVTIQG